MVTMITKAMAETEKTIKAETQHLELLKQLLIKAKNTPQK